MHAFYYKFVAKSLSCRYIYIDIEKFHFAPITINYGLVRPLLVRVLTELGVSPVGNVMMMAGFENRWIKFSPSNVVKEWAIEWLVVKSILDKNSLIGFRNVPFAVVHINGDVEALFSDAEFRLQKNTLYIPKFPSLGHASFIFYGQRRLLKGRGKQRKHAGRPFLVLGHVSTKCPNKSSLDLFEKGLHKEGFPVKYDTNDCILLFLTQAAYK